MIKLTGMEGVESLTDNENNQTIKTCLWFHLKMERYFSAATKDSASVRSSCRASVCSSPATTTAPRTACWSASTTPTKKPAPMSPWSIANCWVSDFSNHMMRVMMWWCSLVTAISMTEMVVTMAEGLRTKSNIELLIRIIIMMIIIAITKRTRLLPVSIDTTMTKSLAVSAKSSLSLIVAELMAVLTTMTTVIFILETPLSYLVWNRVGLLESLQTYILHSNNTFSTW